MAEAQAAKKNGTGMVVDVVGVPGQEFVTARFSDIQADKGFNARQTYKRIPELAEDIKRVGLLQPLGVCDRFDGKAGYSLVYGFRRHEALKLLSPESLTVRYLGKLSPAEARARNVAENEDRDDLTAYEKALVFKRMRDEDKLTYEKIGELLKGAVQVEGGPEAGKGWSKGYVHDLVKCLEKLHPSILKAWAENSPWASVLRLRNLANLSHEQQLVQWREVTDPAGATDGEDTGDDGDGEGKSGGKAKGSKARVNKAGVEEALGAAKWMLKEECFKLLNHKELTLAVSILDMALGKRKSVPGLTDATASRLIAEAMETKAEDAAKGKGGGK